ncbi:hypothetical protein PR048_028345 [Dryococelus australis]|uniref:Uncharacterized protein n=1 Tax=Dryococelus australis TaxID=614101 RepID=A0ABQ9GJ14_9NEOP|nr:hypothetical protein PR048_028345 [Dryococelus australis]
MCVPDHIPSVRHACAKPHSLCVTCVCQTTFRLCDSHIISKLRSLPFYKLRVASVLAVIQVVISSVDYERKNLPFVFPAGASHRWGYSIILAWLVFILLLFSGFAFMLFSRKRKGSRAPTEEMAMVDEPTIIGR